MASRNFDTIMSRTRGIKVITGSFRTNGAGAVDQSLNKGLGFTVARTGVGLYVITLNDYFHELVAGICSAPSDINAAGGARICSITSVDLTTKQISLALFSASSGAAVLEDPASDLAHRVSFTLCLRDTSLAY